MDDHSDVEQLVREIQAGRSPEENFERLFDRYCSPVTHFFVNRGFSDQEAEDLAQDSLLRVYRNIGRFRFEASFDTWLFQIAGNVWKNALRSQATRKRQADRISLDQVLDPEEREPEPEDPSDGPLEQALADERTRLLHAALDTLPPKMRACMLLRLGQGMKYHEIAAVMRVTIATVKSQLSAAQKRLRPLLEKHSDVFVD